VYNNLTNNIYPGQNYGVVVEYDPPGPANDVALCAGPVTGPPCGAGEPGILVNNAPTCLPNLCPQGIDAGTLSACGVSLCPTGVGDPDTDQLALCDLGPLCPGGVSHADPGTLAACGHGPLCQSGVIGMPAPGQLVVVCEKAVTACSLSGDGPGDGWTVGVQGVCVGLPWVVPNGAPCPGATVNVRIYWGTTPGFTQGSTFDACF
jgi:hypothetical protein